MRIIFMGTPDFSVSFLDHLMQGEHEVVAVMTQPDRPSGRGRVLTPPPVKVKALSCDLPVFQPENLKDPELVKSLKALNPDLFIVVAYSILPKVLLEVPHKGSINIHTSLLPKYRGAAPIQWAIVKGEETTGVTLFQLDEKMDHGPIVEQVKVAIDMNDRGPEVYQKLLEAGKPALDRALQKILTGKFEPIPQDHSLACGARKLRKEDGVLDFSKSALSLHNSIRGLFPWPCCYALFEGKMLKVFKSKLRPLQNTPLMQEGRLKLVEGNLLVSCSDKWLELVEVQPEGKKAQSGASFWNGLQNKENPCLLSPE